VRRVPEQVQPAVAHGAVHHAPQRHEPREWIAIPEGLEVNVSPVAEEDVREVPDEDLLRAEDTVV
jgi:hypothetical protein